MLPPLDPLAAASPMVPAAGTRLPRAAPRRARSSHCPFSLRSQSQGGSLKEPTPAPCGASTSPNLRVLPGGAAWRGERLGPCRGLSSWCILQNAAHLAPLDFFYAEEGLQWDRALPPPSRCSPAQLLAFGCCCKGKGMSAVPGMDFFICAAVGDGSRRSCTH